MWKGIGSLADNVIPQMRLWPTSFSISGRRDWNCVKGWSLSRAGQEGPEDMIGGVKGEACDGVFSNIVSGTSGAVGAVGDVGEAPLVEGVGAGAVGTVWLTTGGEGASGAGSEVFTNGTTVSSRTGSDPAREAASSTAVGPASVGSAVVAVGVTVSIGAGTGGCSSVGLGAMPAAGGAVGSDIIIVN